MSGSEACGDITMIGYGTFINREEFIGKKNVRVVTVKEFRRVFNSKIARFPFALPDPDSSFKAVAFDVDPALLPSMDDYESCGGDPLSPKDALYYRTKVSAEPANGGPIVAWMYIPGEKSYREIKKYFNTDLSPDMDLEDRWLDALKKKENVVERFPDLFTD